MHIKMRTLLARYGADPKGSDSDLESFYDRLGENEKLNLGRELAALMEQPDARYGWEDIPRSAKAPTIGWITILQIITLIFVIAFILSRFAHH